MLPVDDPRFDDRIPHGLKFHRRLRVQPELEALLLKLVERSGSTASPGGSPPRSTHLCIGAGHADSVAR
jgi:hypothetical protein